jgi:SAM-dependent methyltransferase
MFDERSYLQANPDVARAVHFGVVESGYAHFLEYGIGEKRLLSKSLSRTEKVLCLANCGAGLGLEVGPSHSPVAPKSAGFNVRILDHLSASGLRDKYANHGVNLSAIEEVDYVWNGELYEDLVGTTRFDWIVASHVVEHIPNLIAWLRSCERILTPGGVLSLIVPDARFCFDALSPLTKSGEVIDAWDEKRERPSAGQVWDHCSRAVHLKGALSWAGALQHDRLSLVHETNYCKEQFNIAAKSDCYVDVHCWRFVPLSFDMIIRDLCALELIDLSPALGFESAGGEFFVSLMRGGAKAYTDERRLSDLRSVSQSF